MATTEERLERYREADRWPLEEALTAMLDHQNAAYAAVRTALPALAHAVEAAAERLGDRGGRLVYAGAGTSGRIAVQDGVELDPTFSWPRERLVFLLAGGEAALTRSIEGAEDDTDDALAVSERARPGPKDVVVSLAASGNTAFTVAAQRAARRGGALTIALANTPRATLLDEADIAVPLPTGPEFLAGSTRMTAGTAQKIALNLFSTQLMTKLGRVYQGWMVKVRPTNAKLRARAFAMLMDITGCSRKQAEVALAEAADDVVLAVLLLDGLEPSIARQRLEAAGGDLRLARHNEGRP